MHRDLVLDQTALWARNMPASVSAIQFFREKCIFTLPEDYFKFLELCNGGEGSLPVQPFWFQLWQAADVFKNNVNCERDEFYPDLFLIGSSGGGCLIAFKLDQGVAKSVVAMDWLDSKRECVLPLGNDFMEFVKLLGRGDFPPKISIEFDDL